MWVLANLHCLQCGRFIGRLAGPRELTPSGETYSFSVFRSADPSAPPQRLRGDERFRCPGCGGRPILDAIERFSTYHEPKMNEPEDDEKRRGRRPRPIVPTVDPRLRELGLADQ